jgi:thiol-disulfide isomerase/thioredoxin
VCADAWGNARWGDGGERFLRAAFERSRNLKVRALCCFSLGKHQKERAWVARTLNDPIRGEILARTYESLGQARIQQLRSLDAEKLEREAEERFHRTIKEFGDLQPMGMDYQPLGDQAKGELFEIQHLSIGRIVPELDGEDLDRKPLKLSDFRGKVVVVSFWATWCSPCMQLVPHEKALVEKMKGRPFVLIGVNGDDDREKARAVAASEGMTWRSFWSGGRTHGIPVQWGVKEWPTIYVIDANGVIRDDGTAYMLELFRSDTPNKLVEAVIGEAEKASKK